MGAGGTRGPEKVALALMHCAVRLFFSSFPLFVKCSVYCVWNTPVILLLSPIDES
jgi:hypothetical protein